MKREPVEANVLGLQNISSMCLVCGQDNALSLHAHFLNLEDGSICGIFETKDEHQSYPGRVHGGIISAILDETIGRAAQNAYPDIWGVTMELTVKFRQPVPLDVPIKAVARITKMTNRIFEGSGEIVLEDGTVAAQATARYANLPVDVIAKDGFSDSSDWRTDTRDYPDTIAL